MRPSAPESNWAQRYTAYIPRYLHVAIVTPAALLLLLAFPLLISLSRPMPARVLATNDVNTQNHAHNNTLHIQQAAFFPPSGVSALDPRFQLLLQPFKKLNEDLNELDSPLPRLISPFDPSTSPESTYVNPKVSNGRVLSAHGMLVSYLYTMETNNTLWHLALAQMNVEEPENQLETELKVPTLSANLLSMDGFNFYPGASRTALVLAISIMVYQFVKFALCLSASSVRCRLGLVFSFILMLVVTMVASTSLTSILYPEFHPAIHSRFLVMYACVASFILSNAAETAYTVPRYRTQRHLVLNRFIPGYSRQIGSTFRTYGAAILVSLGFTYLSSVSASLQPLIFTFISSLVMDFVLTATYTAAVVYIDMILLEKIDFLAGELQDSYLPLGTMSFKLGLRSSFIFKPIRKLGYLMKPLKRSLRPLVSIASVTFDIRIFSLAFFLFLTGQSSRFLYRMQPNLTCSGSNPKYVDMFMYPESTSFANFDIIHLYSPLIVSSTAQFNVLDTSYKLEGSTLRYGSTSTVLFETMSRALLVVGISMCGIKLLIHTNEDFDLPEDTELNDDETFHIRDVPALQQLDIVGLEVNNLWVALLSLDRVLCVFDGSNVLADSSSNVYTRPPAYVRELNLANSWPVRKLLLNSPAYHQVGIFHHQSVDIWNYSNQLYSRFEDKSLLGPEPLCSWFSKDALYFVSRSGYVVRLCPHNKPEKHILKPHTTLRWAVHVSSSRSNAIKVLLCDTDNHLYVAIKSEINPWNCRRLRLAESVYINYDGAELVPEAPKDDPELIPWTTRFTGDDIFREAHAMPDVQHVVLVSDRRLMIMEINSGVFIRYVDLGGSHSLPGQSMYPYLQGSLKVSHTHPTPCVFCGFPAVARISLSYKNSQYEGELVCHTLVIENRSRTNICLRVERDPHDTRCLDIHNAHDKVQSLSGVQRWCSTPYGYVIGVRIGSFQSPETAGLKDRVVLQEEATPSTTETGTILSQVLSLFTQFRSNDTSSKSEGELECFVLGDINEPISHKIPESDGYGTLNGSDAPLLPGSAGPMAMLDSRSACVAFGNTLKVIHLESGN